MAVVCQLLSHLQLFMAPWIVAHTAPLSMEFSRQECWSGLPFPSPGKLPNTDIEAGSPTLQADVLPSELLGKPEGYKTRQFVPESMVLYLYLD